jgi:hypothetical protein
MENTTQNKKTMERSESPLERKGVNISARVTAGQKDEIIKRAEYCGLTVSEYIVEMALSDNKLSFIADAGKLIKQLYELEAAIRDIINNRDEEILALIKDIRAELVTISGRVTVINTTNDEDPETITAFSTEKKSSKNIVVERTDKEDDEFDL